MRLRLCGALGVLVTLLALVGSAGGGTFTSSAVGCGGQVFEQPFLRWLDPLKYVLAPSGTLETTTDWKLAGGAKRVSGNESFYVHSARDRYSLTLPSGSSATTRPMCVGIEHPELRFFATNSGSTLSTLKVEVLFEDTLGNVQALTIAMLPGTSSWQPTLPIVLFANAPGSILSTDGTTAVAFRFTPQGTKSGWRIDDVYVDPFKGR